VRIEAYASQVREFIAARREARPTRVPAADDLAAGAVVEAAHRAAASFPWHDVEQA